jgi:hypothetical protein
MAADAAIESGQERITHAILDGIRTDESTQRAYERSLAKTAKQRTTVARKTAAAV